MAFDWKQGLLGAGQGGLSGAATGAALGGPMGAGVGGVLSALLGLLGGGYSNNDPKTLNKFSPEIQGNLERMLTEASGGNPSSFDPIEKKARQDYSRETVPSILERFTAMGGGQSGSALSGALGAAGVDLDTNLAALRAQFGQNQLSSLLPAVQKDYQTNQPGFNQSFAEGLPQLLQLLVSLKGQKSQFGNQANNGTSNNGIQNNNNGGGINRLGGGNI